MGKPNFSGRWKFNAAKSRLEIPPPDSTSFVIDHREPLFRLSRTHVIGDKTDTFTLDLTTDGTVVSRDLQGMQLRARLYWDDDTLVFDTTVNRGGNEGAALNYDNTWVLDKV